MNESIKDTGEGNTVQIGDNMQVSGSISGNNNKVEIAGSDIDSQVKIRIQGDNNTVIIGPNSRCRGLDIRIGSHVQANSSSLKIGDGFTCENNCKLLLYNSGNKFEIGNDCMFSNSIVLRGGEIPHLIFEKSTGQFIDTVGSIFIGDHVWIGEGSYLTKRARVAPNCIVAAQTVVTRQFDEENCVIGGNPGKVVKRDIEWIRNRGQLVEGSPQRQSFLDYQREYPPSQPKKKPNDRETFTQ